MHMLYACCLEGAQYDLADEAFAKLTESYYDWNEVRVTAVKELAEVMNCLPDADEASVRLKRTLHSLFETYYSFDIDQLKKQNLGKTIKEFEKLPGVSPFVIAYTTQNSLGGHAIPLGKGAYMTLIAIGAISPEEAAARRAPGLERAIPKSKGIEFGSLLHQLGVDFHQSPFSQRVRAILMEISPDAKERMPKRKSKKKVVKKRPAAAKETKAAKTASSKKQAATKKSASKKTTKKQATKSSTTKKSAAKKTPAKKAAPKKTTAKKKSATKRLAKKKPR